MKTNHKKDKKIKKMEKRVKNEKLGKEKDHLIPIDLTFLYILLAVVLFSIYIFSLSAVIFYCSNSCEYAIHLFVPH